MSLSDLMCTLCRSLAYCPNHYWHRGFSVTVQLLKLAETRACQSCQHMASLAKTAQVPLNNLLNLLVYIILCPGKSETEIKLDINT